MFRLAFVAYLFVVSLAGPSFCCCSAEKVGDWLAGTSRSAAVSAGMHTCCSGKRAVKPTPTGRTDACVPAARSASDGHDCDCPEHDSEAVQSSQRLDTAKASGDFGVAIVWPLAAHLPVRFGSDEGRTSLARPVRASFAHLGAQEILRALQRFLL